MIRCKRLYSFCVPLFNNIQFLQNSVCHRNLALAPDSIIFASQLPNGSVKNNAYYSVSAVESSEFNAYEKACEETLDSLSEYLEELVESNSHLSNADVSYSDGVLTLNLGSQIGTYVINRQIPNRQIWLSSPQSGPKRYDFVNEGNGYWLYKHDGRTLHQLLQEELKQITKTEVNLSKCAHSKV